MHNLRKLTNLLLRDEDGISSDAWDLLRFMLERDDSNTDIILAVRAANGRFYLPSTWED